MHFNWKNLPRYDSLLALLLLSNSMQAADFSFSRFSLTDWEEKSFVGHTDYQLINDDGEKVLYAKAETSASGLFSERKIDLEKTPLIKWRWKIKRVGQGNDELSKQGDDYPVRLYVIVSGGLKFWKSYSLVYVWSNSARIGESWDNPYTSNVKHIAVESGAGKLGQWLKYQRDVKTDFNRLFGFTPNRVDAIAVMTDSDNSKQTFESWYGDITFIKELKDG